MLDVWRVQNLHMTLINEKKALGLFVKLILNTQLIFSRSTLGIETLEQVMKYVQSFIVSFEQISLIVPTFPLLTSKKQMPG